MVTPSTPLIYLGFFFVLLMFGFSPNAQAQKPKEYKDGLDYLLNNVSEGKTYALSKARSNDKEVINESEGYYIRLVPPQYKTVREEVVLSPAINGNLDTSNYFVQTEVLVLREPGAEWKLARVSHLCMSEGQGEPQAAICLLKMVPKYQIVHRKFYPFKNILDTTNTDNVIPAKTIIIEREELVSPAKLERIPLSANPVAKGDEKLIKVPAGTWRVWSEVTCPFGKFNEPDIRNIQIALQKQGYDIKITNSYDEQTKRAVHQFQLDNMINVGELEKNTLQRLGVEPEKLITIEN